MPMCCTTPAHVALPKVTTTSFVALLIQEQQTPH
jgi:hypothetical protein